MHFCSSAEAASDGQKGWRGPLRGVPASLARSTQDSGCPNPWPPAYKPVPARKGAGGSRNPLPCPRRVRYAQNIYPKSLLSLHMSLLVSNSHTRNARHASTVRLRTGACPTRLCAVDSRDPRDVHRRYLPPCAMWLTRRRVQKPAIAHVPMIECRSHACWSGVEQQHSTGIT